MYFHKQYLLNTSSGNLNNHNLGSNCLPAAQSYSTSQLMNRQPQLINSSNQSQLTQPTQSYNYNHWLIQEAELRRQMTTRNGTSLIASTKNHQQQSLHHQTNNNNIYKDDQPVYENTIIYNSHKKQQQLHQMSTNPSYLNKPPFPNPTNLISNNAQLPLTSSNRQQQNFMQQQQKEQKIMSVPGNKKCSECGERLGL